MSEIARRRTDQLRDFVIGLEFSAINFEDSLMTVQDLCQRFDGAGLARAGGAEEEEDSGGTIGRREAGLIHLHVGRDVLQSCGLADDLAVQEIDERFTLPSVASGVRPTTAFARSTCPVRLAPTSRALHKKSIPPPNGSSAAIRVTRQNSIRTRALSSSRCGITSASPRSHQGTSPEVRMPRLHIALQEGFAGDPVSINVDGREIYRKASVRTRTQIGLADSVETTHDKGSATIEIHARDSAATIMPTL